MSVSTDKSKSLNEVINHLVNDNLFIVAAAGNKNQDACITSPASAEKSITVGSCKSNGNEKSSFSNYGKCVDIYAPGENILSTWYTSNTAIKSLSGTSMSTPFISAKIALLIQSYLDKDEIITFKKIKNDINPKKKSNYLIFIIFIITPLILILCYLCFYKVKNKIAVLPVVR